MAPTALRPLLPAVPVTRRAWLRHAALGTAAGLAVCAGTGLAWDADRMLAAAQRHGVQATESVRLLQQVLASLAGRDELSQVHGINEFFNRRIVFMDDRQAWGQPDHWASPIELLALGRGDCEDYAIAKYFALASLGLPVARLRLVYVRAMIGGASGVSQAHMVLAYYAAPDAEPLVLDNLLSEVRPASRRPDLLPVFSFNSVGLWNGTGSDPAGGDPVARLSRWRDVIAKARAEGFR